MNIFEEMKMMFTVKTVKTNAKAVANINATQHAGVSAEEKSI